MFRLGQNSQQLVRIPRGHGILTEELLNYIYKTKMAKLSEDHKNFEVSICFPHLDLIDKGFT